nr:hypothetical protein [uncultured Kingella sp.]
MGSGWFDYIGLHFRLLMGRDEVRRVGLRQWQAWVWRRNAMKKGMGCYGCVFRLPLGKFDAA